MNTAKIKAYAPQAREDFINAVTQRANIYGIFSDDHIEPIKFKGDLAVINDRAFTKKEGKLREKLVSRVKKDGFEQVMRAYAYTWFNRFVALRYMELHNYLDHGYRVLSNPGESDIPEILEHAADVDFPGLDKDKVIELRLAGNKDNELYRLLIVAQCNAMHDAMPFLFERIDSETELLLPDNLLHFDSIIRKMVTEINEKGWNDVEIIGWIYQFYISERKNEVIGKVVKSEDIPAATQLFTPNWIVKYMVQNTLGRMWLATYPDSPLKDKMEYYIESAEQETEVQKQLDDITPKELNPEEITFLDPACGSGHILVEAYDVLKEIYLERGYRTRDIPRLILEKNLYGLDIDDRAAQLACFAVLMKARGDDSRILSRSGVKLNIMAIQETSSFDTEALTKNLLKEKVIRFTGENELFPDFKGQMALRVVKRPEVSRDDVIELLELFHHGKTFGSLITIPESLAEKMPLFARLIEDKLQNGDMFERTAASKFKPVVDLAMILARKYDCVVTNPPYMGSKGMNLVLKDFAKKYYPDEKADLFAMFIAQGFELAKSSGFSALITMQSWMFLSSFQKFREKLLGTKTLLTMAHLGARAFGSISGEVVQTVTFICLNRNINTYKPVFFRLIEGNETDKKISLTQRNNCFFQTNQNDFKKISGSPIAYWASNNVFKVFEQFPSADKYIALREGIHTSNNELFLRRWTEVRINKFSTDIRGYDDIGYNNVKWLPYNKGGPFRKWYGNNELVICFDRECRNQMAKSKTHVRPSQSLYFKEGGTWSALSSGKFGIRYYPDGYLFDSKGQVAVGKLHKYIIAYFNSCCCQTYANILMPTLDYKCGDVKKIPFQLLNEKIYIEQLADSAIELARQDWDSFETSWDFQTFPLLLSIHKEESIKQSFRNWQSHCTNQIKRTQELETENNRLFIEAYGLQDELTPEVPEDQITLARADQKADIKRLISYSIGCMMGRYSLNQPGLIYANSGNEGFDPSKYKIFPADDDGIIPIMDMDWFDDDATNRFVEFIKIAWSPETLDENLKFIADSLKPKNNEVPIDTIRRYLSAGFFKDHLKTYKKRPIYWLFSSGKQKAFECLVYLHRYNESILSRMRSAYITPLQGNFNARIEFLEHEKNAAATASVQRKIQKEIDVLKKKQAELSAFDDELRHFADMKISLDLDDGVKVNYCKFGNLLAEKKTVTGKK